MSYNKKSILAELKFKKRNIDYAQSLIDQETERYYGAIKKSQEFIDKEMLKIEALKETFISVCLEYLVEEVAKAWDVNVEDLKIDLKFNNIANGKLTKKSMANLILDKDLFVTLKISHRRNFMITSNSLNLKTKQKDDKSLLNYLDIETKCLNGTTETNFVCPDYKNLIFSYKLGDLINFKDCKPWNKTKALIYDTYEKCNENKIELCLL